MKSDLHLPSIALAVAFLVALALPVHAQVLQRPEAPKISPQGPTIRAPATIAPSVQPTQFTVTPSTLYGGETAEAVVVMPQPVSRAVTVVISTAPGDSVGLQLPRIEIPAGATRGVGTIRANPTLLAGTGTSSTGTYYAHVGALDKLRAPSATITARRGARSTAVLCDRVSGLAVRFTGAPIETVQAPARTTDQLRFVALLSPGAPVTVELTADCIPRAPVTLPLQWLQVPQALPPHDLAVAEGTAPMIADHVAPAERLAEHQRIFGGLPTAVTLPTNQRSVTFNFTAGTSLLTVETRLYAPSFVTMPHPDGYGRQGEYLRLRAPPACRESYTLKSPAGASLRSGASVEVVVQVSCLLLNQKNHLTSSANAYGGVRRFRLLSSDPQALPAPDTILQLTADQASLKVALTPGTVTAPRSVSLRVQPIESAAPASAPLNLSVIP